MPCAFCYAAPPWESPKETNQRKNRRLPSPAPIRSAIPPTIFAQLLVGRPMACSQLRVNPKNTRPKKTTNSRQSLDRNRRGISYSTIPPKRSTIPTKPIYRHLLIGKPISVNPVLWSLTVTSVFTSSSGKPLSFQSSLRRRHSLGYS